MIKALCFFGVGVVLIVLGYRTWKTQIILFLKQYYYRNVKEEDMPAYTKAMGIALMVIGAGPVLSGLLSLLTDSTASWAPALILFLVGFLLINRASMKYHGDWFTR
jgi:hypothetical protein